MTNNYIIIHREFLRKSAEIGERIINAATSKEMYANVHELSALLKEWDFTHDERRPRPPDDGALVTRRNAPAGRRGKPKPPTPKTF